VNARSRSPAARDDALRPETRVVYLETPSNPLLQVVDIRAAGDLVRARGIELFVDSTFASPYLQEPLALGATLVLHSGTKLLGGHSDVMCGAVAGRVDLVDRIRAMQILVGSVLDPQGAWLLLRSIKYIAAIPADTWYAAGCKTPCGERNVFTPSKWGLAVSAFSAVSAGLI
jgi:cystathionine beta-lyase/cystathionine gamma-synthase